MSANTTSRMNLCAAHYLNCQVGDLEMSEVAQGTFYRSVYRHDLYHTYRHDGKKITVHYFATDDEVMGGAVYPSKS